MRATRRGKLTTSEKGRIAEAAVLFRLACEGFDVLRAVFEGDVSDWVVRTPSGHFVKLQVRWAGRGRTGAPCIRLTSWNGGKNVKYDDGDVDFIVAYDLWSDRVCIFPWAEVRGKSYAAMRDEAVDRWDLIGA